MKKRIKITLLILLIFSLVLSSACAAQEQKIPEASPETTEAGELKVMTHDSFAMSEDVLRKFESDNNIQVQFIKSGDTGTALNKAILAKDNPLADVFYGVDNTFLSRALDEGVFEPYQSPMLAKIDDSFKMDPENRMLPVDFGDVCLNYDKVFFENEGIDPPKTLNDLLKPTYSGMLVVQNPATSSPGLSFLLTTIGNYGPDGYLEYWKGLVANDVLIVNDWESAYYTEFSGSSGKGPRPIVVSYDSSPAFEILYAESPLDSPPTAAVVGANTCFRQIEFAGILKGTKNRDLAEKWIDFMLSVDFQEDMPLQMFVFPVNREAALEDTFIEYLVLPERTAHVDPEEIANNREKWLKDWTETVLR
jgi:thiamine transport system substrate-binding protein